MIQYDWRCTACGKANLAGTDTCAACGSSAMVSAFEIQRRQAPPTVAAQPDRSRPLFILVHFVVTAGGALMLLLAPREMGEWYFFSALFVLIAGSNVAVALLKWCMRHLTYVGADRER